MQLERLLLSEVVAVCTKKGKKVAHIGIAIITATTIVIIITIMY